MHRNMICSNCNKEGHIFNNCEYPINSYGLILARKNKDGLMEYIMIRRKHSFGYMDFVKGKYLNQDLVHIKNSIEQMSIQEKEYILKNKHNFRQIWSSVSNSFQKRDYIDSLKKFENLQKAPGGGINEIFKACKSNWEETEWEFPKGRKMPQESEKQCAIREFQEETGITIYDHEIIDNVEPLVEIFCGSNYYFYKHNYYIAFTKSELDNTSNYQKSEVSKVEWKTFEQCLTCIRSYHDDKKMVITRANNIFKSLIFVEA